MILNNFFNIHPQLEVFRAKNNNSNAFKPAKPLSFTGATDIFTKHFIETQKEIEEIFIKDPESNWIAGSLPAGWIKKLENYPADTKNEIMYLCKFGFGKAAASFYSSGIQRQSVAE